MRNKKVLPVIMAMVLACSGTTVTMAKSNPLPGFSSTTSKVDLQGDANLSVAGNVEEAVEPDKKIVKPEIKFVNKDTSSLENADISEEEAQKAQAEREMDAEQLGYDADSIIVIYEKGSEESELDAEADLAKVCKEQVVNNGDKGGEELIGTEDHKIVAIDLNDDKSVETAIEEYEKMDGVICAEPNYIMETQEQGINTKWVMEGIGEITSSASLEVKPDTMEPAAINVNDTGSGNQWYLDKINVKEAWDLVSNSPHSRVKVCILDSGCTLGHRDLGVNTVVSRELVQLSNGSFGTWPLYGDNYFQGSRNTIPEKSKSHGSMVTGVLGGVAGNSYGIAGVASCYNNDVLDMVVVDVFEGDTSYVRTLIRGLEYSHEIGAKVVNMSLGGSYHSETLENTCNMLNSNGIVLVAAAGNSSNNIHQEPSDLNAVISVVATDQNNNKADFSSYGSDKDICAPGTNIYTTCDKSTMGKEFTYNNGTSFSAPIVTGIVAMMLSINPRLTPAQVKSILCQTATDLGAAGKDTVYANGLVNAGAAVRSATVKAIGVYPVYQDNSIVLGCEHQGGIQQTKYRWEYCNMDDKSSSWQLISDWNTSEWCTWYPDANTTYAVVCKVSYFGNGVADSQIDWYVSRPQMNAKLSGTCVMPSGNGILLGCTSTTDKYYTALYVFSYATGSWIIRSSSGGSACWYQADGLPKGTYMAYFCTEDTPYGRKLSTSYYNFTVD